MTDDTDVKIRLTWFLCHEEESLIALLIMRNIFVFSEPRTEILGEKELFVDYASSLNLTCLVKSPDPPAYIFWKQQNQVCKFQTEYVAGFFFWVANTVPTLNQCEVRKIICSTPVKSSKTKLGVQSSAMLHTFQHQSAAIFRWWLQIVDVKLGRCPATAWHRQTVHRVWTWSETTATSGWTFSAGCGLESPTAP